MNRIQKLFEKTHAEKRGAYVAYLTMGCPSLDESLAACEQVLKEGADILELGIPFSDPVADGEVIRLAAQKALAGGATLTKILAKIPSLRAAHPETPLVVFSYYNPIYKYGIERFAADAAKAGVDAVLVVDLPLEERDELIKVLKPQGLTFIPLISPTTGPERIVESAKGLEDAFLYAVTVKGVTGARQSLPPELTGRLEEIKRLTSVPVVAGFGITTPEEGAAIAQHCDGFVIGSANVRRLQGITTGKKQ